MGTTDKNTTPDWTKEELVYMACFIDCEGTVEISRAIDSGKKHGRYYYIPHFKVCNTDKALIDWAHRVFGGQINNVRYANGNWNTLYYIRWNCKKAERVLQAVYPYMKVKKLQATIVMEFLERMGRQTFRGVMLSEHEYHVRGLLYGLIRKANKRGAGRVDAERLSEEAASVLGQVRQSELAGNELQELGRNVQAPQAV